MEIKQILLSLKEMQEEIEKNTKVCVCNSNTMKIIEDRIDIPPNIVLVEDNHIEDNQMLVVENKELKKLFLEKHKLDRQEKVCRSRMMKGE